jgi:ubiquinone/menaquinone biosynthesis C-methylase UbiE
LKAEQVLQTYDEAYARAYDGSFLTDPNSFNKTAAELAILRDIFASKEERPRWLDVACGTGYMLSQFSDLPRTGLDLSPAMLHLARSKNPGIRLIEGNYRDRSLIEAGQFDVVSSMWWAYSFAESIDEIQRLIDNLWHWLAAGGVCFMPICEPAKNLYGGQTQLPYVVTENAPVYGGQILLTAVMWSWIEPSGKRHDNMLVPQVDYMVEMFRTRFSSVEVREYAEGYYRAIIAIK